jgi:glycosyltransferase involved in cell wall biosynthesis
MKSASEPGRPRRVRVEPDLSRTCGPAFPGRCVVLIPALNERGVVGVTVAGWIRSGFLAVRVIDNGSTDGTAVEAGLAGADVVTEPTPGYGSAARRGLRDLPPETEWVLFSSADGSDALSPAELQRWSEVIAEGADLVLGDRCSNPASSAALNLSQRVCSGVFRQVVRLGWGRTFNDVGSLRAVRLATFAALDLQDRGFGWNVEMQIRAIECGLRVQEIPVCFRPRRAGQSKISGTLWGTLRAATAILRMLFHLWRTRRHRVHREGH